MLSSVRHLARSVGVGVAFCYALARACEVATRGRVRVIGYRFVAQPVAAEGQAGPARGGAIELRSLAAGDPLAAQLPRPPAVIARRFADGARCLVAVRSGRVVGCLWYQEREYVEDEVRCRYRFDPDVAVWDFDVYVDPEFRLGRLFARLWDCAHSELRARGYAWTFSRISAFNAESLAAHARLGARPLGGALFLVAGRLQVSFASLVPYVHFGWREDMYPVYFLSVARRADAQPFIRTEQ